MTAAVSTGRLRLVDKLRPYCFIWAVLITIFLAEPLQAQDPPLENIDIPPRDHQEFLRKAREGELVRPGSAPERRLLLEQIREDFLRIQIITANDIRPATSSSLIDYKRVAKAAAEIKRRASRLKSNLVLPDPGKEGNEGEGHSTPYPDRLIKLDSLIKSFVSNPIFRETGVIDAPAAFKASRDLRTIIRVSDGLRKAP